MIDARGLSCPMPVVMVQKAVKAQGAERLEVLLDAECSVENVSRYAANHGYAVTTREQDGDTLLIMEKK